jgi:hypothetical protein
MLHRIQVAYSLLTLETNEHSSTKKPNESVLRMHLFQSLVGILLAQGFRIVASQDSASRHRIERGALSPDILGYNDMTKQGALGVVVVNSKRSWKPFLERLESLQREAENKGRRYSLHIIASHEVREQLQAAMSSHRVGIRNSYLWVPDD